MEEGEKQIQQARDISISAIAQTMVIYGVTPSVGRIYGVLYFAEEPMSLDEIKDEVAMSKGSVSNGIRELLETEMVIKVWKKGDRKDHYIAEKDFFRNFFSFFVKNLRMERNLIAKANEQAKPLLREVQESTNDEETRRLAEKDLAHLQSTEIYLEWLMRFTNAMENGEIFEYFPKKGEDE
ncbi:DNA-binding transcriptional regulator GbsR (MarR family) [Salsuginibacillus halophilus]|uniref:HTH-type transcriptional regulator n=1 Tax=Salsuginibacillus halophilus TaxID=517424 RepID=A0A2P8H3Q1_9BACI|nr:transcriptional regulator [Salsuginibacillus halophilus]PSL40841.1 DNA-binding transcriptional regulator GbsR (MarR family) [Salsuginibacillus halophilus]